MDFMQLLELLKKQPAQNQPLLPTANPLGGDEWVGSFASAPQSNGLPPRNRSDIPVQAPMPEPATMPSLEEVAVPPRSKRLPFGEIKAGSEYSSPLEDEITTLDREKKSGLIDKPFYKDNDRMAMMMAALSDGFGGMTLRGKSGMGTLNKLTMANAQRNMKDNKTMDYMVQNNPEMAEKLMQIPPEIRDKYMGEWIKTELGTNKQFRTEVSTMRVDEKTGRMYYLESDGQGNQQIIYAKDADGNPLYGDTGAARQEREIHAAGVAQARAQGGKFFEKSESLRSSLDTFKNARVALDSGARSGIIDSALPALDANTQNLRSLANTAGIEVINSATFGALSEKELALAMSTGIPINLPEDQLDAYLEAKIKAQEKLYSEIEKKAQQLNSGDKTLGQWQAYWKSEERPESYNDEYASRFGTDKMDTSYKGWTSAGDGDDEETPASKRWEYVD